MAGALLNGLSKVDGATLITLSGELGAGKTTLSQSMGKLLGVSENMTSPTFVLERVYELPHGKSFKRLVHIDAYRLSSGSELSALGFDELMKNEENLVVLEWPEKVADTLPKATLAVTISIQEDGSRLVRTHENT